MDNPLDTQIGGDHYKQFKIQPIAFIKDNGLDFCQGNVIKYICRYKFKNGKEDLLKIKHYIDVIIAHEYATEKEMIYPKELLNSSSIATGNNKFLKENLVITDDEENVPVQNTKMDFPIKTISPASWHSNC